jgi:hypothetical protein
MAHTQRSRRSRVRLAPFAGVFLAVALAITSQAGSEGAWAKNESSRAKGTRPEAKGASVKTAKPVNNPFPSLHRDLLTLEEGQKNLQRQLENLIGATHRRSGGLEQQIDSFNGQLSRLALQQQELTKTQQLLTSTIRSTRLLLMIISGLLLVVCGVLIFFVYQVKQFGGFRSRERKQISAAPGEAPDRALEPQWKVDS